jgi:hypothetical protein
MQQHSATVAIRMRIKCPVHKSFYRLSMMLSPHSHRTCYVKIYIYEDQFRLGRINAMSCFVKSMGTRKEASRGMHYPRVLRKAN